MLLPPLAPLLLALLNQPRGSVHSEEEPLLLEPEVHLVGLLPQEHRELMLSDPLLRMRGVLLEGVLFLVSQSPQRPLVPPLQVRRVTCVKPYRS